MKINLIKSKITTIADAFEILPKSDKTVVAHHFRIGNLILRNCLGHPSEYLVCENGKALGIVKYYKGRKLTYYLYDRKNL